MKENLLVTGADGMVGSYVAADTVLGRGALDVTDYNAVVAAFERYQPTVVLNLAAVTDQSMCEKDPARAYLVNAVGAYHVALAARTRGVHMVHVSTNAVFSGPGTTPLTTEEIPNPLTAYGRSKYAGECLVREVLPDALIVRTSWIFGGGPTKDKKFVGTVMRKLGESVQDIQAAQDVQGTPTYAKDLAARLQDLAREKKQGLLHITNSGVCSRYDMALAVQSAASSRAKIIPVPASTFGFVSTYNEALEGETLRPWQDALRDYIQTEWSSER